MLIWKKLNHGFKDDRIIKIMAVHVGKRMNDFYKKFGEEIKRRRKNLL